MPLISELKLILSYILQKASPTLLLISPLCEVFLHRVSVTDLSEKLKHDTGGL